VVFFTFARQRGFPVIAFSALRFFRPGFGFIGFVSSSSCLASQQVSHFSRRDRQVAFVGYGFFGYGILLAVVS
jgi:hypothetical protein